MHHYAWLCRHTIYIIIMEVELLYDPSCLSVVVVPQYRINSIIIEMIDRLIELKFKISVISGQTKNYNVTLLWHHVLFDTWHLSTSPFPLLSDSLSVWLSQSCCPQNVTLLIVNNILCACIGLSDVKVIVLDGAHHKVEVPPTPKAFVVKLPLFVVGIFLL